MPKNKQFAKMYQRRGVNGLLVESQTFFPDKNGFVRQVKVRIMTSTLQREPFQRNQVLDYVFEKCNIVFLESDLNSLEQPITKL